MSDPLLGLARAIACFVDPEDLPPDAAFEAVHLRDKAEVAIVNHDFVPGTSLDHTATLAGALSVASPSPLVTALHAAAKVLIWHYGYAARPGEADLSDRIAFAELIGPDAFLYAPGCRIGFTLMAPKTSYPMHAHPAIELYRVIAGEAEWQTPQSARILPAGATILHPANLPHAMRSFDEPLLALYGWRGDIDTPPYYLRP